jgi:hypothetical protein
MLTVTVHEQRAQTVRGPGQPPSQGGASLHISGIDPPDTGAGQGVAKPSRICQPGLHSKAPQILDGKLSVVLRIA